MIYVKIRLDWIFGAPSGVLVLLAFPVYAIIITQIMKKTSTHIKVQYLQKRKYTVF